MHRIVLKLIVAMLAVLCGVRSHAATPVRKAVIGHAALNARVTPLWVAEDFGFFVKHGVSANAIFIRQAPVLVAALTADCSLRSLPSFRPRIRSRVNSCRNPVFEPTPLHNLDTVFQRYDGRCPSPGWRPRIASGASFHRHDGYAL